jgi:hypothetical protein
VGEALDEDGEEAGIAEDGFIGGFGGGVGVEGGLDVGGEELADFGDAVEEGADDFGGLGVAVGAGFGVAVFADEAFAIAQAAADLGVEDVHGFGDQFADSEGDVFGGEALFAEVAGEDDLAEEVDGVNDRVAAGEQDAVEVFHRGLGVDALDDGVDDGGEAVV